jgi:hypothetical protein
VLHDDEAEDLLGQRQRRAETEADAMQLAVLAEVLADVRAVADDVKPEQGAAVVEVPDAEVDLLLLALALEHEGVDVDDVGVLGGEPRVGGVVPGDEEARIGQADHPDDVGVDQHALERPGVGDRVPLAPELLAAVGQGDAEELVELGLPVERRAVEVVAPSVDDLEPLHPGRELLDRVGQDLDVVVHQPDPVGAELEGDPRALAEAAGAPGVGREPVVDQHAGGEVARRGGDDVLGVVGAGVVHHDDPERRGVHRRGAGEQLAEEGGPVVRHDRDRDVSGGPSHPATLSRGRAAPGHGASRVRSRGRRP